MLVLLLTNDIGQLMIHREYGSGTQAAKKTELELSYND
jgi:hypothetical protein